MNVITTRELSRLQEVPIESIIEKFNAGTPLLFVDPKLGKMQMYKISPASKSEHSITLSNLRASPRKVLSKEPGEFVVSSIGAGIRGGMREPAHWWLVEPVKVVLGD